MFVGYVVQLLVPAWHIVTSLSAACTVSGHAPLYSFLVALLYYSLSAELFEAACLMCCLWLQQYPY
jgi:hypothetical protein